MLTAVDGVRPAVVAVDPPAIGLLVAGEPAHGLLGGGPAVGGVDGRALLGKADEPGDADDGEPRTCDKGDAATDHGADGTGRRSSRPGR